MSMLITIIQMQRLTMEVAYLKVVKKLVQCQVVQIKMLKMIVSHLDGLEMDSVMDTLSNGVLTFVVMALMAVTVQKQNVQLHQNGMQQLQA